MGRLPSPSEPQASEIAVGAAQSLSGMRKRFADEVAGGTDAVAGPDDDDAAGGGEGFLDLSAVVFSGGEVLVPEGGEVGVLEGVYEAGDAGFVFAFVGDEEVGHWLRRRLMSSIIQASRGARAPRFWSASAISKARFT